MAIFLREFNIFAVVIDKTILIMKKFIILFIAMTAVMAVQAQSICGSWQSAQPKVKNLDNGTHSTTIDLYAFGEDGTFVNACEITYSTKPSRIMEREVALNSSVSGTYKLEGDKLVMKFNMKTYNLEVTSISENGKVINTPEAISLVEGMFNNDETKKKIASELKNETFTVKVTGNGSMLELTDSTGETMRLKRIPTIKH